MMKLPKKVIVCEDVTRDGFQSAVKEVAAEDKVRIIDLAADAGVPCFEVGAFTPNSQSMRKMWNTKEVFRLLRQREGISYRALIFDEDGVREAYEAGCPKVKINISASNAHHKSGAGMTTEEALKQFAGIGRFAGQHGIEMCGSISLPFVSPFPGEGVIPMEWLKHIIRGFVEIGITEISLSDAAGLGNPQMIYERFTQLKEEFCQVSWMLHMHNTWGMGLAGVLAALEAGVTKFDASLAGLGGCPYLPGATGNVATEDLVFMLNKMGIETGIDVKKLIPAGQMVRRIVENTGTDSVIQRDYDRGAFETGSF